MFHALDVLASKCRVHVLQTAFKITVSCLDAYPSIHVALRMTIVPCSTRQQVFKQQVAPWSVTGEVWTSDPSFLVEFLGLNDITTKEKTQRQRSEQRRKVQKLGHVVAATQHSLYTKYRVRWRAVLLLYVPHEIKYGDKTGDERN